MKLSPLIRPVLLMLALVLLAVMIVSPINAQDVTPESVPSVETVIAPYGSVVGEPTVALPQSLINLAVVGICAIVLFALGLLYRSTPNPVVGKVLTLLTSQLVSFGDNYVKSTSQTGDDEIWNEAKRLFSLEKVDGQLALVPKPPTMTRIADTLYNGGVK